MFSEFDSHLTFHVCMHKVKQSRYTMFKSVFYDCLYFPGQVKNVYKIFIYATFSIMHILKKITLTFRIPYLKFPRTFVLYRFMIAIQMIVFISGSGDRQKENREQHFCLSHLTVAAW